MRSGISGPASSPTRSAGSRRADARLAPHVGDGLHERLVVDHGAVAEIDRHVDAARITGLGEKRLGLGGVVGVWLERGIVTEVRVGQAAAIRLARARVEVLD